MAMTRSQIKEDVMSARNGAITLLIAQN